VTARLLRRKVWRGGLWEVIWGSRRIQRWLHEKEKWSHYCGCFRYCCHCRYCQSDFPCLPCSTSLPNHPPHQPSNYHPCHPQTILRLGRHRSSYRRLRPAYTMGTGSNQISDRLAVVYNYSGSSVNMVQGKEFGGVRGCRCKCSIR
jgi:hypothetical protein